MLIIRRLNEADNLKSLFNLSKGFFLEYENHHPVFFKLDDFSEKDVKTYFSSFVNSDDRAAFVAIEHGRIIGYIAVYILFQPAYWEINRIGHISGLMVDQKCRRTGVAHQLFNEAKRFFKDQGVKHFTVYTAVKNKGGIEFYTANGMEPLYQHFLGEV